METLKDKQLKVLNDTANYFNLNNRSVIEVGRCKYHIDGKQGCAIGRLIEDIELKKELDLLPNTGVNDNTVFNKLPDNIKELGQPFLTDLQRLHDNVNNWDEKGLSVGGYWWFTKIKNEITNKPIYFYADRR